MSCCFFIIALLHKLATYNIKGKLFFIFSFPSSKLEVYNFLILKLAMQIWLNGLSFMDFFSRKNSIYRFFLSKNLKPNVICSFMSARFCLPVGILSQKIDGIRIPQGNQLDFRSKNQIKLLSFGLHMYIYQSMTCDL